MNMKKTKTYIVNPTERLEFILEKGQQYFISPVVYTNPNNPMSDAVFKPLDPTSISIESNLSKDGKNSIVIINNSSSTIDVEVYQS